MISITILISTAYILLVLLLIIGWERLQEIEPGEHSLTPDTRVSIIIPVRNEAKNILKLLDAIAKQDYPFELLEVLVVDDFSTDTTAELVINSTYPFHIRLLRIPDEFKNTPNKKRAITLAIEQSQGELIVTTDGDCIMGAKWLKTIENYYREHNCKLISGPVFISSNGSIWEEIQQIEFSSLIGSGGACMELGFPNMCNGANLAYSRNAFYEVGGFAGNESIASGDDEFLMHKIYHQYPNLVKFLKSPDALVISQPQCKIQDFLNQRIRWAGKWPNYRDYKVKLLAIFIFVFNLSLLINLILTFTGLIPVSLILEQLILKILAEFVFLRRVMLLSGKKMSLIPFLILQATYPIYVLITSLLGLVGKYEWKERTVVKTS